MFKRILSFGLLGLLIVAVGYGIFKSVKDESDSEKKEALERAKAEVESAKQETDAAIERAKVEIAKVKEETNATVAAMQIVEEK